MSEHTPGPWHAGVGDCKQHGLADGFICRGVRTADGLRVPETAANLILQAAAPDLLGSLKCMADALNMARLVMKAQETRDLAAALVADARAVIAKAEGR